MRSCAFNARYHSSHLFQDEALGLKEPEFRPWFFLSGIGDGSGWLGELDPACRCVMLMTMNNGTSEPVSLQATVRTRMVSFQFSGAL